MGFGDTARKLQSVADTAEDVYRKLTELREQVVATRESVERVDRRTDRLEAELAEQRALLDAVASELDVDVAETTASAHIEKPARPDADGAVDGERRDESAGKWTAETDAEEERGGVDRGDESADANADVDPSPTDDAGDPAGERGDRD